MVEAVRPYRFDLFAKGHPPQLDQKYYIDIVWPRIDEYVRIWNENKANDYFAAARAMQKAIRDAGIKPPDWPEKKGADFGGSSPMERRPGTTGTGGSRRDDLDDDIPF
jgi:hypothetical protein